MNNYLESKKVTLEKKELLELVNYCIKKSSEESEKYPAHLNIKQIARYLNYSEAAIYRMVSNAVIPNYKISGGKLLFKKNEIDDWLFQFKQKTKESIFLELDNNPKHRR